MKKVRSSENQCKLIEWISFSMAKWVMEEIKMVEVVMKETRNSNSINRSMRWKVSAEHLSSRLKFWLLKKRFREKKMRN